MITGQDLKIAVIGPTQSGKTCLAVGLRSISTRGFTIQPVDEDARQYLDDLKIALCQTGSWPDASNLGTDKSLRFDFLKEHKDPIRVEFPEYPGEMLQADRFTSFANKQLRGLSGVVLLINPGAAAFHSGDLRVFEDYMAQYEHVLSFLRDSNNESDKAFVALTITAADRIDGDLRGKLDLFNECVRRLSNTLTASGFNWKRFDVTVTGHLKDQAKPKLAEGRQNSAAKPFLWILDRLIWQPLWMETLKRVRNFTLAIVGLAAQCGIGYGVYAWNVYEEIVNGGRRLEEKISKCGNKDELRAVVSKVREFQTKTGLFAKKVREIASRLEPKVWDKFVVTVNNEIGSIRVNPEDKGSEGNCAKVDNLFSLWSPEEASCKKEQTEMKDRWNSDKLDYRERFYVKQMLEGVRVPLEGKLLGMHGEEVLKELYSLYQKLDGLRPRLDESRKIKEDLSSRVDTRVAEEWYESAFPEFEATAKTNATAEKTRDFITLLDTWTPATTNGVVAKAKLWVCVTNAAPRWRAAYETTTFSNKMDEAVKSRSMEELAKLYPERVETNEYLSAAFISKQWEEVVKPRFDESHTKFLGEIVTAIVQRSGRPVFMEGDKEEVRTRAEKVGVPFDETAAVSFLTATVKQKEEEWELGCRTRTDDWVNENVDPGKKRTGQGGLWAAYDKFAKEEEKYENPFVQTEALTAVYKQVEQWLTSDIESFGRVRDGEDVKKTYDRFKALCREVFRRNQNGIEQRTSWACYFAIDCEKDKHLDAAGRCFPRTLKVEKCEGRIDYEDFRCTYEGTDLQMNVNVFPLASDSGKMNRDFVLKTVRHPSLQRNNNQKWIQMKIEPFEIKLCAFDVLAMTLVATDRIKIGRNLLCDVASKAVVGCNIASGKMGPVAFDGMMDLGGATKVTPGWALTTNDLRPGVQLKIWWTVSEGSVQDYVEKAKKKAAEQRESAQ